MSEKNIQVEIERSRLNQAKASVAFRLGILLYISFLFIGIVGFINGYITQMLLNMLVVMGIIVLIVGTVPYIQTMILEDRMLNSLSGRKR